MSLSEKVEVLRVQLGLKQGLPLAEVVLQAVQQLGLGAEVGGLNLVQKVDACLSMLSLPAATSTSTVVPDEMEREPTGLEPGMQITVNTPQGPIQTVPDGVETGQQFQINVPANVSAVSVGVAPQPKVTRYVQLHWPSTDHPSYGNPDGPNIHAQLVSSNNSLLVPAQYKIMNPTGESANCFVCCCCTHTVGWHHWIQDIEFGKSGIVQHCWRSLTVRLDFGRPVETLGVRSDSKVPFTVEYSNDAMEWVPGEVLSGPGSVTMDR